MTHKLTLKQVYQEIEKEFRKANVELPKLEAKIFSTNILNISSQNLFAYEGYHITKSQYKKLKKMVELKKKGMPTAYIINQKEFFEKNFFVNQDVLIPRPETEELIEWIITEEKQEKQKINIDSLLDFCCGSGCIGISLLTFYPDIMLSLNEVIFSDISFKALKVAKKNAKVLLYQSPDIFKALKQVKIKFICSDLFSKLNLKKFDLIVSNPPYITASEMKDLMPSVKNYEPRIALEIPKSKQKKGQKKDFFYQLVHDAYNHLKKNGRFYMECNPLLILDIYQKMQKIGFQNIKITTDLSGKNRFIKGIRK